jgi:proline racemase
MQEVLATIDLHTEGEPLRVLLRDFQLPGQGVLGTRHHFRARLDQIRTALMWEPRGHRDMYGCVIVPPQSETADFGTFFLHNEGYSSMCGHAIIALATLFVSRKWVAPQEPLTPLVIEVPAGVVQAYVHVQAGQVKGAFFDNVPAFVAGRNLPIEVPDLGTLAVDLAFGGAFYAYVDADQLGLDLQPSHTQTLIQYGMAVKRAVAAHYADLIQHPEEPELSFLYGTIFTSRTSVANPQAHSRQVCVFAEGEVDRSPTGTGVSGRLALLHQTEALPLKTILTIESIIGSQFTGSIQSHTRFGSHPAIIPRVGGRAWITGEHRFFLDPADPWRDGFLLQ